MSSWPRSSMGACVAVALFMLLSSAVSQLTIVAVVDEGLEEGPAWVKSAVSQAQSKSSIDLTHKLILFSLESEDEAKTKLCDAVSRGTAVIVDLTAGGWTYGNNTAQERDIPYVWIQISNHQWIEAVDNLLPKRNVTDAALIFGTESQLDQALSYLAKGSASSYMLKADLESNATDGAVWKMKQTLSHFVLLGTTDEIITLYKKALQNTLVSRGTQWILVATDHHSSKFNRQLLTGTTGATLIAPINEMCCKSRYHLNRCSCDNFKIPRELVVSAMMSIVKALKLSNQRNVQGNCKHPPAPGPFTASFYYDLLQELDSREGIRWNFRDLHIIPQLRFKISELRPNLNDSEVGSWTTRYKLVLDPDFSHTAVKRFFRIGTIKTRPWITEKGGSPGEYEGFCVDFANKLKEMLQFEYEFVFPEDGRYGESLEDGSWNGVVGDLVAGETDIIVAPLTITAEREKVIDFVSPYFATSGISIVMRKQSPEEHLFYFLHVFEWQTWMTIIATVLAVAFLIWLIDFFSPFSKEIWSTEQGNHRQFTPYKCFWYAVDCWFVPGGGEPPKSISGRILVAGYWLFVVLILATFTANLAAFLTVERMKTSVASLEELVKQNKINYTVVKSTSTEHFISKMATVEDSLFRMWKGLTFNLTTDHSDLLVLEYPVKEQYGHMLRVIEGTGHLESSKEGYDMVLGSNRAFIHDAVEIRYEVTQNCDLTEVGEPFAEQPYGVAVQQGSRLQKEIRRKILELQRSRYFENLSNAYWGSSAIKDCPNNDQNSIGISLNNLGGVFITTVIGLVLAMVVLVFEVLQERVVRVLNPRKKIRSDMSAS